MIGRFSIYVLIKFEIRLRLKVIYSRLLALDGTFRTVATQTPESGRICFTPKQFRVCLGLNFVQVPLEQIRRSSEFLECEQLGLIQRVMVNILIKFTKFSPFVSLVLQQLND